MLRNSPVQKRWSGKQKGQEQVFTDLFLSSASDIIVYEDVRPGEGYLSAPVPYP